MNFRRTRYPKADYSKGFKTFSFIQQLSSIRRSHLKTDQIYVKRNLAALEIEILTCFQSIR